MNLNFKFLFFAILLSGVLFALPLQTVFASTTDGTILGYGWSSQVGWINFGTTNGASHITDSGLTGYAWNENTGRINLNPSNGTVTNNAEGSLSGRAWSEGTGWINFSGVTVNSSGVFSGSAIGDNSVTINFDCTHCNVSTDWRPLSTRGGTSPSPTPTPTPGSGHGGVQTTIPAPTPPATAVIINGGQQYTNNQVVTLTLDGGDGVTKMAISNSPDFLNVSQENVKTSKTWDIGQPDGSKTVYVKFYNQSGGQSDVLSDNIILDTKAPSIAITSIQSSYNSDQEVIIKGTSEANASIRLSVGTQSGLFSADGQGEWFITIGKMSVGNYHIEFTAKDAAENASNPVAADFSVVQASQQPTVVPSPSIFDLGKPLAPILRKLEEGVTMLIPKFLQPIAKRAPTPVAISPVPKTAPLALTGAFHYLSSITLGKFVLSPLPKDINLLAQKFPQVQKTFNDIGVKKITDVQKLVNSDFKLPNLTESVTPMATLAVGNFAPPKSIPVEGLSSIAKSRIPSEIVFAKAGKGLVDLDVALSFNEQGMTQQTIETVSGHPLQLVVRVEKPAKQVVGYLIFKSKRYNTTGYQVPLNAMSASLLFANPNMASAILPNAPVLIEGANQGASQTLLQPAVALQSSTVAEISNSSDVEKRLILSTFGYIEDGNGVYTATINAPAVDGEYEIVTQIEYQDALVQSKEIKLITVVDPEGYVYEKNGDLETRISGAIVSLYWLNPDSKQYELWNAKDFQQEDPQTTDQRGTYSFLVPNGYYYLKVDAPGYLSYDGKPFQVKEGSGVHINIELKTRYWFLNIIDWRTLLLVAVVLLLVYNFYRDKKREKISPQK